jgi:hypothetical protein
MSFDGAILDAVRDRIVVLTCGDCWLNHGEDQVLDRLRLHPALEAVIPVNLQRPHGKGVCRVQHRGPQAAGMPFDALADPPGRSYRARMVERGAEDGTITWYCPRGHSVPLTNRRLLGGFLSVARPGQRPRARLRAGIDV